MLSQSRAYLNKLFAIAVFLFLICSAAAQNEKQQSTPIDRNMNLLANNQGMAFIGIDKSLIAVDLTSITAPTVKKRIDFDREVHGISISQGNLYAAIDSNIITYEWKANGFHEIERTDYSGTVQGFVIHGNDQYCIISAKGKSYLIIRDMHFKRIIGKCKIGKDYVGMAISGNKVFIADNTLGLQILDIRNPHKVKIQSSTKIDAKDGIEYQPVDIFVEGSHAYVLCTGEHSWINMMILDLNASKPKVIGQSCISCFSSNIWMKKNIAFISRFDGFYIMDVKNPGQPELVAKPDIETGDEAQGIYADDKYAYVLYVDAGSLRVFDISSLSTPTLAASYIFDPSNLDNSVCRRSPNKINGYSE